jgi:hypothetical protein
MSVSFAAEPIAEPTPSMKYAKSMTGHLYSYPVHTAGEFKNCILQAYQIPPRYLHLLEPEDIQEMDEKGEPTRTVNKYDDDPLLPDVVYYLLCDPLPTQHLLDWIRLTDTVPSLRLQNPSYRPTMEELNQCTPDEFEHFIMQLESLDGIAENLHRFKELGWKRLFLNPAAAPFLEQNRYKIGVAIYLYGHILAVNSEAISLITRLLQDNTAFWRSNMFWKNLNENENAVSLVVETYPEHIILDSLSRNPAASSYFLSQYDLHGEAYLDRLNWKQMSAIYDYYPLLARFPERIDPIAIQYNIDPAVIEWLRVYLNPEEIRWDAIAKHTHPDFVIFMEENIDHLTEDAWKCLCYNPFAVPLLTRYPEKIHWTLLCCNPSVEVIPMIETYLTSLLPRGQEEGQEQKETEWSCRYNELTHALDQGEDAKEMNPVIDCLSDDTSSSIGTSFVLQHIEYTHAGHTVKDEYYRGILNRGALSLHPHSLSLLRKYPFLIHPPAFTRRKDIYINVTPPTLD